MEFLPKILVCLEFALLAAGLGVAGFFLTRYGDVIAEKTGLGGTWVGLAMLATVTSLPELVTGISAVSLVDAPNIALGDAVGSCVFNLLLIVMLDFLHRGASVYTRLSQGHILAAGFSVILLGFVAFNILLLQHGVPLAFGHVGIATPVIVGFYGVAMYTVFQYEKTTMQEHAGDLAERYPELRLSRAIALYAVTATIVVAVALRLPATAERMAELMGWHRTFVGTLFVALATSLPELAVTVSAVRIGALDMAISNLLGSNLFNLLIVAIDDLAYLKGPLLAAVSPMHLVSALTAIMMTGIAIVGLLYRPRYQLFKTIGWASFFMFSLYVLNITVLYLRQE